MANNMSGKTTTTKKAKGRTIKATKRGGPRPGIKGKVWPKSAEEGQFLFFLLIRIPEPDSEPASKPKSKTTSKPTTKKGAKKIKVKLP